MKIRIRIDLSFLFSFYFLFLFSLRLQPGGRGVSWGGWWVTQKRGIKFFCAPAAPNPKHRFSMYE